MKPEQKKPVDSTKEFRNKYVLRFCDYVNGVFNLDRIDSLINDYKENYIDKLAEGKVRWKGADYDDEKEAFANFKNSYSKNFDDIRKFFENRPKYALEHMGISLNDEQITKLIFLACAKGNTSL